MDLESAVKLFEKKFLDKTKNKWADRDSFTPKKGKYTLIEMADEDEVDTAVRFSIFLFLYASLKNGTYYVMPLSVRL